MYNRCSSQCSPELALSFLFSPSHSLPNLFPVPQSPAFQIYFCGSVVPITVPPFLSLEKMLLWFFSPPPLESGPLAFHIQALHLRTPLPFSEEIYLTPPCTAMIWSLIPITFIEHLRQAPPLGYGRG